MNAPPGLFAELGWHSYSQSGIAVESRDECKEVVEVIEVLLFFPLWGVFHGKEKEVGERHELSGQKKKKDVGIDFLTWKQNSWNPHTLNIGLVDSQRCGGRQHQQTFRVIPARGGFPPFTPCASATSGQDSCCAAASQSVPEHCELALFFTQDQQKYWVCNSDAGALKYVISASLSHTWPHSHSSRTSQLALPPPRLLPWIIKNPCAPNLFTLCRKSPQTSTGCPAHPNWYLCGVHIITGLVGKSRTLASESFPQTTALEELLISSTDTSRMRRPLSFCCRKINQKGAFPLMWLYCPHLVAVRRAGSLHCSRTLVWMSRVLKISLFALWVDSDAEYLCIWQQKGKSAYTC